MKTFNEGVLARDTIRALLKELGIKAECIVVLSDAGVRVDVTVITADLKRATEALHDRVQSGSVQIHKAVQPKP